LYEERRKRDELKSCVRREERSQRQKVTLSFTVRRTFMTSNGKKDCRDGNEPKRDGPIRRIDAAVGGDRNADSEDQQRIRKWLPQWISRADQLKELACNRKGRGRQRMPNTQFRTRSVQMRNTTRVSYGRRMRNSNCRRCPGD
jgi:hypothetical protein